MERVIVVHDGSADCEAASRWASWEAARRGLPLQAHRDGTPPASEETELVVACARDVDDLSRSPSPCVLVPEKAGQPVAAETVLGVDARDPAPEAVAFAFDTARRWGVRLRAVHAWRLPAVAAELRFGIPEEDRAIWEDDEVHLLSGALRPWREKYPEVEVLEDVRLLTPVQALVRQSANAGLVVVGRRPGSAFSAVVRGLVARSRCPVAVVPS
ncbi:universal stress protein [Streptomyces sp. 351MFTsu5.1]|uniref:universal stress protein n=1 Tax=Streptomyces sp. 351MFTsu5.1 TaxID=1172180 RepID=UPI0003625831|nr:universal stress protein [Streptomyces sp. 351MFTsu5.1]